MNKLLKILFALFVLNGCSYEPLLIKKNYDFYFLEVKSEGEIKINKDGVNFIQLKRLLQFLNFQKVSLPLECVRFHS